MKILSSLISSVVVAVIASVVFVNGVSAYTGLAGTDQTGGGLGTFARGVLSFIDGILLPVILGLAFLMFVWGVFKFFILGGSDEEAQQKGKSLMLYAVAGFVLILSFYGIVSIITNGLGLGEQTLPGAQGIKTGFTIQGNSGQQ